MILKAEIIWFFAYSEAVAYLREYFIMKQWQRRNVLLTKTAWKTFTQTANQTKLSSRKRQTFSKHSSPFAFGSTSTSNITEFGWLTRHHILVRFASRMLAKHSHFIKDNMFINAITTKQIWQRPYQQHQNHCLSLLTVARARFSHGDTGGSND